MNTIKIKTNNPTVVSLFAGCGGSSLGYKQAGYNVKLAVEWDDDAVKAYKANFPETSVYHGDVAELSNGKALQLANIKPGELDVLDGSPPCQGFSTAGKREMSDPRNMLFLEYVRLVKAFHPKAFVMENVSGMIKGKAKISFAEILKTLKSLDYVVSCRLLNAWWYGTPQDRKRVIFIGIRKDQGKQPSHPTPTRRTPVTVGSALKSFSSGVKGNHQPQVAEAWLAADPGKSLRKRRPYVGSFQSVRLDENLPSPTQIAAHRNWRWDCCRKLTVEETKVIQGFPLDFIVKKHKQVGNSVPPPMMKAVGLHIKEILGIGLIVPSRQVING